MRLVTLMMSGLILAVQSLSALPEPYESVRTIPGTPYFVQDSYIYYDLINTHNAAVIVDVESQDGGVARLIAQQSESLPSLNRIYSVSAWTDCATHKRQFQRFLSNVKQENSAEKIIPIRMNSQEAALSLNITADFISIVGGNDANIIYKDILAWYQHLAPNGVLCGNNWYDNSVELGVTKAADALELTLHVNNNVWYFVKD